MSYATDGKWQKRRPHITRLSAQAAIERVNTIVDDCNQRIAQMAQREEHWYNVAADLAGEIERLDAENKALKEQVRQLEKRIKTKIGKKKRENLYEEDDRF